MILSVLFDDELFLVIFSFVLYLNFFLGINIKSFEVISDTNIFCNISSLNLSISNSSKNFFSLDILISLFSSLTLIFILFDSNLFALFSFLILLIYSFCPIILL
jgi:hypothetical protein